MVTLFIKLSTCDCIKALLYTSLHEHQSECLSLSVTFKHVLYLKAILGAYPRGSTRVGSITRPLNYATANDQGQANMEKLFMAVIYYDW